MTSVTIYHNPRCSKSRQTLEILQDKTASGDIELNIIEYLKDTPSASTLEEILKALGMTARELLRTGEDDYKGMGLEDEALSETDLVDAMTRAPILIERPIVVCGEKARIGRPPESVLEIL